MALVVILFLAVFFFVALLGYALFFKKSSALLKIAIIFIIVFLTIVTLTFKAVLTDLESFDDYDKLGTFGDYVGGILNPLISGFAVFAAGFAFYAQYQANKQVQKQFKIQKFESQFYERLRLVKEEINTIYLPLRNNETLIGRKVFYELDKEIKFIHFVLSSTLRNLDIATLFKLSYHIFFNGRKNFFSITNINKVTINYQVSRSQLLDLEEVFADIYKTFVDLSNEVPSKKEDINPDVENDREKLVAELVERSENTQYDNFMSELFADGEFHYSYLIFKDKFGLNIRHMPFKGLESKLSIVFRQLFSLVKFVSANNNISYEEQRNYLRVLRSILSNYEQLHIFYNWYSEIGSGWENGDNKFLTDFRMIHNLPPNFLIQELKLDEIFDLNGGYRKEAGRDFDTLFEYQD